MENPLTERSLDALKELVNIGVGRAAKTLSEMLQSTIQLQVPTVSIFDPKQRGHDIHLLDKTTLASVQLRFHGAFAGNSALVFPPESAAKLVTALTGEEAGGDNLDAVMAGTLSEVGNIVINAVIGSISNILQKPMEFSLPSYLEGELAELLKITDVSSVTILLIRTTFLIEKLQINGDIYLVFEVNSFGELLSTIDRIYEMH